MKKRQILKALSLLAAVCIAAGCNGNTAVETTSATAEITTATAEFTEETEVTEQTMEPIPEGWSVEKIAALIEIDGNPLKFPCTPEEFESLSEKITLGEPDEYFNYCDIYYDDVNIGTFALNKDSGYCDSVMLYTDLLVDIGNVSINKCEIKKIDIISTYFNENFHDNINQELSSEQHKVLQYLDDDYLFVFSFRYNEELIEMIHLALNNKGELQ